MTFGTAWSNPIHEAAKKGDLKSSEVVSVLVENGSDPLLADRDGKLADDWAREAGHQRVCEELLGGLAEKLFRLVESDNLRPTRTLLQKRPQLVQYSLPGPAIGTEWVSYSQALHRVRSVAMTRLLLEAGANVNGASLNASDQAGHNALHYLAGPKVTARFRSVTEAKMDETARLLMQKGADPTPPKDILTFPIV